MAPCRCYINKYNQILFKDLMNDINEKASEKSLGKGAIALRKKIIGSGKVKDLVTTEDNFYKLISCY